MFQKEDYIIKMINRDGLELKGYYDKVNNKKCVVAFCGFGGNCDTSFCAIAEKCIENNISFLFSNTQGSYVKKELKKHLQNNGVIMVEKGAFNEDFDECVKDLSEWIEFATKEGFEEIYLLGASIACNRIVNYLNNFNYPQSIKKVILECPQNLKPQLPSTMIEEADELMSENLPNNILTDKFFGYCEVTAKTIYNMVHNKNLDNLPYLIKGDFSMLKNISLPIRVVIGSQDEGIVCHSDKSVNYFMDILKENSNNLEYTIIDGGRHNFKHKENELADAVLSYIINE